MDIQILIAALLSSAFVFLAVLSVSLMIYSRRMRQTRLKYSREAWLFYNWSIALYDLFIKAEPIDFGKKIGFDVPEYLHNCEIAGLEPKPKDVLMKKVLGYLSLVLFGLLGLLLANVYIIFLAVLLAVPLIFFPTQQVVKAAKIKKFRMIEELPRFIDLFGTALMIGMPVEEAILTTAKSLPDLLLAGEFLKAIAETRLGVYDWQAALERMSRKYEVDVLSDFSLELINSYNKGVPIADAVARKSKDIKQSNLLTMKERATKLTSTILLPVLVFKVLPLLALLCIPVIGQIINGL